MRKDIQQMLCVDSGESGPAAHPEGDRIASFANSFVRLPERFYARVTPTPVA